MAETDSPIICKKNLGAKAEKTVKKNDTFQLAENI